MGFLKEASAYLSKNLSVARAMAKTPAGASFIRWGGIGAGMGAIYGAADNLTGNDRTSVIGGAMRGAAMGMGARGLFGGFKGLRTGSVAASTVANSATTAAAVAAGAPAPAWGGINITTSGNIAGRRWRPRMGLMGGPTPRGPAMNRGRGHAPIRTPSRRYVRGQGLVTG